jgi:hypothetical protein
MVGHALSKNINCTHKDQAHHHNTTSTPTLQLMVLGSIWGFDPEYMACFVAHATVKVYDPSPKHLLQQYASYCKPSFQKDQFTHFNNGRFKNKQQLQELVYVKS